MGTRPFLKVDKELLPATKLINLDTGVTLNISVVEKHLYSWFIARYEFWQAQGKVFYDNQIDIAKANAMSISTVKRFIKEFTAIGVITKGLGNGVGERRNSNNYVVRDIFKDRTFLSK